MTAGWVVLIYADPDDQNWCLEWDGVLHGTVGDAGKSAISAVANGYAEARIATVTLNLSLGESGGER